MTLPFLMICVTDEADTDEPLLARQVLLFVGGIKLLGRRGGLYDGVTGTGSGAAAR
jgi:hypothetical protein